MRSNFSIGCMVSFGLIGLFHTQGHASTDLPSFGTSSFLSPASSAPGGDQNVAAGKFVYDSTLLYLQGLSDVTHAYFLSRPQVLFDGNFSTGSASDGGGNITVDLGNDYVIDSCVFLYSGKMRCVIQTSRYYGQSPFPSASNPTTGVGAIPKGIEANLNWQPMYWVNAFASGVLGVKTPATVCRFINFNLEREDHPAFSEIQVFGHPFVARAGDRVSLPRTDWLPIVANSVFAEDTNNAYFAFDGALTNKWRADNFVTSPGYPFVIDLRKQQQFNGAYIVFDAWYPPADTNSMPMAFYATDDTSNWGSPLVNFNLRDSVTINFPVQNKRFVKIVYNCVVSWPIIDEIKLLAPVDPNYKAPNSPPTCAITSPANGATFLPPATIALIAGAVDYDGAIRRVAFYNGSDSLGSTTTAPYTYIWTNVPLGNYTITAKATDDSGATTTSSPVQITVGIAVITQLNRAGWTATASSTNGSDVPVNALDNSRSTRWSSGSPQSNGQSVTVDMKTTNVISRVTLISFGGDYARGFQVLVSSDGAAWGTAVATGSGTSDSISISFIDQTCRYFKIVQTSSATSWWSISETYVEGHSPATPVRVPNVGVQTWLRQNQEAVMYTISGRAIGNAHTRESTSGPHGSFPCAGVFVRPGAHGLEKRVEDVR